MKNFVIEIKWALIFSIITLLWMVVEKSVGLHDVHIKKHPIYSSLFIIPAVVLYFLAIIDKKKNFFMGNMNWKQGFITGVYLSFLIAILSPITQYISITYISPSFFKNAIQNTIDLKMMTLQSATAYFNLKSYILQGIFGALSTGVVISALVAYFLKTKPSKQTI